MAHKNWEQMGRRRYLRILLRQIHDDLQSAREAGSWTPAERLVGRALAVRNELDTAPPEEAASVADATPEELTAYHQEVAPTLPDHDLDVYAEEWLERLGAVVVVEGGRVVVR